MIPNHGFGVAVSAQRSFLSAAPKCLLYAAQNKTRKLPLTGNEKTTDSVHGKCLCVCEIKIASVIRCESVVKLKGTQAVTSGLRVIED